MRYCPLELSWATTIYKFQGFEAGFDKHDCTKRLIADIDDLKWEHKHPGTAYVATSRAKTIGKYDAKKNPNPLDTSLYFTGMMGRTRFKNLSYKEDGKKCVLIQKRDLWVQKLTERAKVTAGYYTEERINEIERSTIKKAMDERLDSGSLQYRIISMIRNPNDAWKQQRRNYRAI